MTRAQYTVGSNKQAITVEQCAPDGLFTVTIEGLGEPLVLDLQQVGSREYHVLQGTRAFGFLVHGDLPRLTVYDQVRSVPVELLDERQAARIATGGGSGRSADGTLSITAPMPGKVVKRLVQQGERVAVGQGVIVVEAMKMENELRSTMEGTIKSFKVNEGDNVEAGECLVLIE